MYPYFFTVKVECLVLSETSFIKKIIGFFSYSSLITKHSLMVFKRVFNKI
jgi:hypothetical protein